jgi:hypothetical protein
MLTTWNQKNGDKMHVDYGRKVDKPHQWKNLYNCYLGVVLDQTQTVYLLIIHSTTELHPWPHKIVLRMWQPGSICRRGSFTALGC